MIQLNHILTSLQNGSRHKKKLINLCYPLSKMSINILDRLEKEGYISGFFETCTKNKKKYNVILKYDLNGKAPFDKITLISKPSKVIYSKSKNLWKLKSGLSNTFISTPKGVLSDTDARALNIGGQVLFSIK